MHVAQATNADLPSQPHNALLSPKASVSLDLLRGTAALLVLMGHLRALFFVDFSDAVNPTLLSKAFYFLTGLGHQGVVVFFVLSGLLIGMSVLQAIESGRWRWSKYWINRCSRLYIVLVPALLLGLFWDILGISTLGDSIYAGHPSNSHILSFNVGDRLNIGTFLANLFFLQEILAPSFGSNGPLWSLSYEFWYYALFPLIVIAASSHLNFLKRVMYGAIALLCMFFVGPDITAYFLIWLMGVVVILLPSLTKVISQRAVRLVRILTLTGFGTTLLLNKQISNYLPYFSVDLITALAFALLCYSLLLQASANAETVSKPLQTFARHFSGFSFSLYLVHMPLLVFLQAWIIGPAGAKWQVAPLNLTYYLLLMVIALLYAYAVSWLTERHTEHLRTVANGGFTLVTASIEVQLKRWTGQASLPDGR
jgi:peptidoglycan/LPS O-acetylase OafA/YrhL